MDNSKLIDQALRAYDIALRQLEEKRLQLQAEIDELTKERESLNRRKYRVRQSNVNTRTRGEAKQIIEDYLRDDSGASLTQSEIATATGVPLSTCNRILKTNTDIFEELVGGKWKIRTPDSSDEELDDDFEEEPLF